jgi:hypothetical protein
MIDADPPVSLAIGMRAWPRGRHRLRQIQTFMFSPNIVATKMSAGDDTTLDFPRVFA